MDDKDYFRVVDHSRYLCRSWQTLHFPATVARLVPPDCFCKHVKVELSQLCFTLYLSDCYICDMERKLNVKKMYLMSCLPVEI